MKEYSILSSDGKIIGVLCLKDETVNHMKVLAVETRQPFELNFVGKIDKGFDFVEFSIKPPPLQQLKII